MNTHARSSIYDIAIGQHEAHLSNFSMFLICQLKFGFR